MIRFLQQNNRLTKTLFGVIIGLAVITMVITLVPGIFDNASTSDSNVYAVVHSPGFWGRFEGGSSVKADQVARLAQRQLQQQNLPAFLAPYVEQRAGQLLVEREMLKHEADRMHLQVSNEDLIRELKTGPFAQYLFPNGSYIGDDAYINFVQTAFGTSRAEFEQQVKSDMELNRLQALITGGATVSDNAVRAAVLANGTKIKFDYAVISSDDLRKTINATDAQLQAFFQQNKARYATAIPEARKISYVAFDASSLPGGRPTISDADVASYYRSHQQQFQVKEQVKVRHILVAVPAGADSKADAAAKNKAQDLLKQIQGGANFADLAKKNSDDPGSKENGGELGWLDRGKTVPEFDRTAFSLAPGQTSQVIKTQFGYHILQVEEKKNAHVRPLDEVKAEIVPVLEQQRIGAAEQAFASQIVADAKKNGLDKAAAAKGLRVVTTDYVGKDGTIPGLADGSALINKAFSTSKGAAPEAVASGDSYAVYQVADVRAAHAPDFAEYKTHLLEDYREQQVPQLLNTQLTKLDERAKQLHDLRKAASELNVPFKTSDLVGKDSQVPDVGAMSGAAAAAFSLAKGEISGPINTGRTGVVLSVVDKQQPSPEEIAKSFDQSREQLLGAQHEEIFRVYLGDLTARYEKARAVRYSRRQPAPGASPFGGS